MDQYSRVYLLNQGNESIKIYANKENAVKVEEKC